MTADFLDRWPARAAAFGVFLACAGTLAWIHRDDLFGTGAAADDPVARCVAERTAEIDALARDGTIDSDRAALFKGRAEALCAAQLGGSGGPPLPGAGLR